MDSSKIDVSVLIPTYNAIKPLKLCCQCLIDNLDKNINTEVIIYAAGAINSVKEYLSTISDKRFRTILDGQRCMPSQAYNKMAQMSTGKYLFFYHDDMYMNICPFWHMLNVLKDNQCIKLLSCDFIGFKNSVESVKVADIHPRFYDIQIFNNKVHFNFPFLINKDDFWFVGGFDKRFYKGFNKEPHVLGHILDDIGWLQATDRHCIVGHQISATASTLDVNLAVHNRDILHNIVRECNWSGKIITQKSLQIIAENKKQLIDNGFAFGFFVDVGIAV